MKQLQAVFLFVSVLFLVGCSNLGETIADNGTHAVTIHAVEYTSRTPVDTVEIALFEGDATEPLAKMPVSAEGVAQFTVQTGKTYRADMFQQGEVKQRQSSHTFVFDPAQPQLFFETAYPYAPVGLSVPPLKQTPLLPNGCEITGLTALLQYYGYDASLKTMARDYLPQQAVTEKDGIKYGPDPNKAYAGDPFAKRNAFYVYAPPVVEAGNRYLQAQQSHLQAYDITGATLADLRQYIQNGIPVVTWVTIDWAPARSVNQWTIAETKQQHDIYSNLHAVVLIGMSKDHVMIMNPLSGFENIALETFTASYEALANRAMTIY